MLDQTDYLSLCHGWSSGPTIYLTENVLRVRSMSAGFATVEIAPHLVDPAWAVGDAPTPHGVIHVRVERNKGKLKCTAKLPPQIVASIGLGSETFRAGDAGIFQVTDF